MANIRMPSPLMLGLTKGIPGAAQSIADAMVERRRRKEEEDLLARAPEHIRGLLGGISPTQAGPMTPSTMAAPPGASPLMMAQPTPPGVSPEAGPLEAALMGGAPSPTGLPAPQHSIGGQSGGPGGLTEALMRPGGAEAFVDLARVGIDPGTLFAKAKAEGRTREGRTKFDTALRSMRRAKTDDEKISAVGLFYSGLVDMDQTPDIGSFARFIETAEERAALGRDLNRFGDLVLGVVDPSAETSIQDRFDLIDTMRDLPESTFFRSKAAEVIAGTYFNVMGPEGQVLRIYGTLRRQGMKPLQAWAHVEQVAPIQAADLLSAKKGPREVMEHLKIQQERSTARAKEIGKREGMPAEERRLTVELKEARLKILTGQDLSEPEIIRALSNFEDISFGLPREDRDAIRQSLVRRLRDAQRKTEDKPPLGELQGLSEDELYNRAVAGDRDAAVELKRRGLF